MSTIPLIRRVTAVLLENPAARSTQAIADEVGSSNNAIGNLFRGSSDQFVVIGAGKPQLWQLKSDRIPPVESGGNTSGIGVSTNDPPLRGEGLMETNPHPGEEKETKLPPTSDLWYLED